MMINKTDLLDMMGVLANGKESKIKSLSDTDKKICLQSVECFLTDKNEMELPNLADRVKKIEHHLQNKKFSLITKLFQAILNVVYCKSRNEFHKKMREAAQKYLSNHIEHYLERHYFLYSNCNLRDAKIYFIGEHHIDFIQKTIQTNLISHLARKKNNVLLEKNLDFKPLPGKKKYAVRCWDNEVRFEQAGKYVDQLFKLKKEQIAIGDKAIKEMQRQVRNQRKIDKLSAEYTAKKDKFTKLSEEDRILKAKRDQDLVQLTQTVHNQDQSSPIFVVAGAAHLKADSYNVSDHFQNLPHVVLMPKLSAKGVANEKKLFENATKKGIYSYSGLEH